MAVMRRRLSLLGMAALLSTVTVISIHAGLATAVLENQTGQVTVFWGRHKDEGSIREACDSGMYTGVIMSFLNVYGRGAYHLDLSGHALAAIGVDIKHCQLVGVNVSLSIRGNYSLPSEQAALDLFDHIWNAYLGGYRKGVRRPFGDAKLDGVDLFVERGTPAKQYYDALTRELAKHDMRSGGTGKPVHLTATLPCALMMNHHIDGDLPITTGAFERIHVRFYDSDGHTDCRAYSEQVWTRRVPVQPDLPRPAGVAGGGQGRLPVSEKPLLWRATGGAEGGQLRRCHALGSVLRQGRQLQQLRQEMGLRVETTLHRTL